MRSGKVSKAVRGVVLTAAVSMGSVVCSAIDEPAARGQNTGPASSSLYLKVQLKNPLKLSKLKTGDVVEGGLARDVYSQDRELFPAGSQVRLAVDHMERRERIPDDHWPWVVKAFTPRHQNYPVFKTATVFEASGESALQVSLISVSRR